MQPTSWKSSETHPHPTPSHLPRGHRLQSMAAISEGGVISCHLSITALPLLCMDSSLSNGLLLPAEERLGEQTSNRSEFSKQNTQKCLVERREERMYDRSFPC